MNSLIYAFFNYLIKINLSLIKNKVVSNFAFSKYAFGDIFAALIQNYNKIQNSKLKILVYSDFEEKLARLFFQKDKIKKTFFYLPEWVPIYSLKQNLKNLQILNRSYKKNITSNEKKILIKILNENLNWVSPKIKKLQNQKYVLLLVKHYNHDTNNLNSPFHRQTSDLEKVFKIINFLLKKKLKIILLGNNKDYYLKKVKKFSKNKNILYFNELSINTSLIDQLFLHYNCKFSIGTDCGAFIMSIFLKKKIIFFDALLNNEGLNRLKNVYFLYKNIHYKGKIYYLTDKYRINKNFIIKNNYSIVENSYHDIKKAINKIYKQI